MARSQKRISRYALGSRISSVSMSALPHPGAEYPSHGRGHGMALRAVVEPGQEVHTLCLNLLHVAAVDYDLTSVMSGSNIAPDFGKDKHNPSRDVYKTKAEPSQNETDPNSRLFKLSWCETCRRGPNVTSRRRPRPTRRSLRSVLPPRSANTDLSYTRLSVCVVAARAVLRISA